MGVSVRTIVGRNGVEGYLQFELPEDEMAGLRKAAEVLKETYSTI